MFGNPDARAGKRITKPHISKEGLRTSGINEAVDKFLRHFPDDARLLLRDLSTTARAIGAKNPKLKTGSLLFYAFKHSMQAQPNTDGIIVTDRLPKGNICTLTFEEGEVKLPGRRIPWKNSVKASVLMISYAANGQVLDIPPLFFGNIPGVAPENIATVLGQQGTSKRTLSLTAVGI